MAISAAAAVVPHSGRAGRVRRALEGSALLALGGAATVALLSYSPADASFNTATAAPTTNFLGSVGAFWADAALQLFGVAGALIGLVAAALGARLLAGQTIRHPARLALALVAAVLLAAMAFGAAVLPLALPAGAGGAAGAALFDASGRLLAAAAPDLAPAAAHAIVAATAGTLAALSVLLAAGVGAADWRAVRRLRSRSAAAAPAAPRRPAAPKPVVPARVGVPAIAEALPPAPAEGRAGPRVDAARPRQQFALPLDRAGSPSLPPLSLLKPPPPPTADIDPALLQENARALEQVLGDYGVEGEITHVRSGPVVTMYELEPAAGTKAARVIGLADDIARSMSAVSARVAVVPGRTIIGIELPNATRETVSLAELLASASYADAKPVLPLVLGKNIAGDPVIADLAPMPHLLIAGTTGSGKSVGLNCMILSLLYRLGPEQCRMIMIDPKMLELSVYDGIPHLLAPVVTEPGKAIRALKWAVEQMEERYRMMASINVRSLAGFNQRVRDARVDGQPFVRRVQTGYDAETGLPQFEEQTFDFEPLPHIVVVVDELADLMMTAGKEVEFLIQRLAQKARAAGIHLIMATQRPSVDVITGVIKANLPTRISFQVTSKIDSRTILGEQGAEQLLGKGDMLYMPGGKQVVRVHGPFVSDEEVERVAEHWRAQGQPDYVSAVTEEPPPADDVLGLDLVPGAADEEADLYRKAVQLVAESRKVSTSYLQRQFRVGYNNAARLVERMEREGVVSPPDHVGRREVLIEEAAIR